MTRHLNSGMPFEVWPLKDRQLFASAFESVDLFDGPGSSLAPTTKYGRKAAYGLWLGFLDSAFPELLMLPPDERVDEMRVEEYVGYLRENCRETTVADCLGQLFYTVGRSIRIATGSGSTASPGGLPKRPSR